MSKMTVQNESGQVVTLEVSGPLDPRARVIEQRIARGELKRVSSDTPPTPLGPNTIVLVEDEHTGMKDEAGNWLKSIHGGGHDPDFAGDALGQPSGSVPASELGDHVVAVQAYREGRLTPEEVAAISVAQLEREGAADIPTDVSPGERSPEQTDGGGQDAGAPTQGGTVLEDEQADGDQADGDDQVAPPARSASKADWFEYATGPGQLSAETAEGLTRDQLADRFLGPKTA